MFLGHHGLAFAAKRLSPKTSFGTLYLSTEFADCLWPLFLLIGWEHVRIAPGITRMTPLDFYDYPLSHSLWCYSSADCISTCSAHAPKTVPAPGHCGALLR